MPKIIYHLVWAFLLVSINLCALPLSIYSLFVIERGTNITAMDYTLAILIVILSNMITFQLFFAIKKKQKQNANWGIFVSIVQIISFILFMHLFEIAGIILFLIAVLASVALMIKQWKNKNPAIM